MLKPWKPVGSNLVVSTNNSVVPKRKQTRYKNEVEEVTGDVLLNSMKEAFPTLLAPIFPSTGIIALGGSSDTGKSSLLRQFAISVVLGLDLFLGFILNSKYKSALYISSEDSFEAISHLINKQKETLGLTNDNLKGLRYIFDWGDDLFDAIDKKLKRKKADVVIIDAFMDAYGGSIKDHDKIRGFLQRFTQLAFRHQCLIIFLHHTGKNTDESLPSKHNFLGAQSFEAKVRLVVELRLDPFDPSIRHLCIVKGNYLSADYKNQSYKLEFDENMVFHSKGERVPFENLVGKKVQMPIDENIASEDKNENDGKDIEILKMLKEGFTYTAIQAKLVVSPNRIRKVNRIRCLIKENEL